MQEQEGKAAVKSTGVLGGLVALLPAVAEALNHVAGTGALPHEVSLIVAAVGGVVAIIGRVLAEERIDKVI